MTATVVFSGGPISSEVVRVALADLDIGCVIAADSGLSAAALVDLRVDAVVGDMDSVAAPELQLAADRGAEVVRFPSDKDATDLELALDHAVGRLTPNDGPQADLVVIGSSTGRMDHLLGWVGLVSSPRWAPYRLTAWLGGTQVLPVHGERRVVGAPGALVSLLALHGPARGVTASGLRWPLSRSHLDASSTLSISNEFDGSGVAHVSVESGTVAVVIPEADPESGRTM